MHISERLIPYKFQTKVTEFFSGERALEVKMHKGLSVRIVSKGRGIMYVDPGLGKTRMAIMIHQKMCWGNRALVVCKKNSLNTWRREYIKWVPGFKESDIQIVHGSPAQRRKLWARNCRVHVTTWDTLARDFAAGHVRLQRYKIMFGDEAQKLRNRKVKIFAQYRKICKEIPFTVFMSGTLLRTGPQDMWGLLHLSDPKKFSSYWRFFNTYCKTRETFFGQEYIGPKNTKSLAANAAPYLVRLREGDDEVDAQRPPKTRDYLPMQMNVQQMRVYRQLNDHLATLIPESGNLITVPGVLGAMTKLRQLLVCPKILDPALGYGAALEHYVSTLEDDPHQVLFTPYRVAVNWIVEAIKEKGFPAPYILQGGSSPDDIRKVEEGFNGADGSSRSAIVTIKFAESFELYTAKQGRFLGFEWTVDENTQAEDRLHRLITPHPVNILYYKYDDTIEGSILARTLDTKAGNIKLTMRDYVNVLKGDIYNG